MAPASAMLLVGACSTQAPGDISEPPEDGCFLGFDDGKTAPQTLGCTGLFANPETLEISPSALEYTPAHELWSDGADKRRYLALPPGSVIDARDPSDWVFPVGTKVWKEFRVGGRLVETRFLWKREGGWVPAVYRWEDDQRRALKFDLGDRNADGNGYEIPPATACEKCHHGATDWLLGFEAVSLGLAGARGSTLSELARRQMLVPAPERTLAELPNDASRNAAEALGWLHVNCGVSCHNDRLDAQARHTKLFLRIDASDLFGDRPRTVGELDAVTTSVGKLAVWAQPPTRGLARIEPGQPDRSAIVVLSEVRDEVDPRRQMPPLATHRVDSVGISRLRAWIAAMPPPGSGAIPWVAR